MIATTQLFDLIVIQCKIIFCIRRFFFCWISLLFINKQYIKVQQYFRHRSGHLPAHAWSFLSETNPPFGCNCSFRLFVWTGCLQAYVTNSITEFEEVISPQENVKSMRYLFSRNIKKISHVQLIWYWWQWCSSDSKQEKAWLIELQ